MWATREARCGRVWVAGTAGLWLVVGLFGRVHAQAPTTVQMPTFHSFSVGTSVLVPDRGSTMLGGIDYARSGSTTRGVPGFSRASGANRLFKSRAFGFETGRSAASVSAWIHDMSAMDAAVLADAAARRGVAPSETDPSAMATTSETTRAARDFVASSATRGDASIASIKAQQAAERANVDREVLELIRQGDAAAESGKPGLARLFYQQAHRLRSSVEQASSLLPSRP